MKARLSCFNQVVEVFEEGAYDDNVYQGEIIIECDETIRPLMWYIDGQFIADYVLTVTQVYDETINGLTLEQYADWLKWRGFI